MKKLLVLFVIMAFMAPAAAVMADDTLDLSGAMRVRAWSVNNSDYTNDDESDLNYWDQRLRIQGVISPADGVKAVFRIDLAEDTWGSTNWGGDRYNEKSELQVDRAYLDVTKGMVNVKAGQQYMSLGNSFAYDNNATGVQVTLNTPVVVRLGYAKIDEGDTAPSDLTSIITDLGPDGLPGTADDTTFDYFEPATATTDEDGFEDVDQYFIDLGYKSDAFSVNVFYAMQSDGKDTADEPNMFGAIAKFGVGPANVMAEFNSFGGDNGADVDYVGIQFIGDVSMKFSDALTAGVNLIYSSGEDEDGEEKITYLPNATFGSMGYADLGPFNTDIMPLGADDVFDPMGTNSGAMGAGIYANFMPMEGLTLSGQYVYLTAVEDGIDNRTDGFDSGYVVGVGVAYTLTQNATLAAEYLMADWDSIDDADIEALNVMVARLQVDF